MHCRYDHYFLRTASYDVPSEAKSAFALEMDDVRVMLRDCTDRSLVMIDELGEYFHNLLVVVHVDGCSMSCLLTYQMLNPTCRRGTRT